MNTVLATAQAEGRIPGSMYDVLYLENEAGYIIENLNPTTDGMYFAWDETKNQIIYIMSNLETVYYPEDYELNPNKCWITVGSAAEANKVIEKGYNIALEKDIEEEIVLSNVVSINTLGFKASTVTFNAADSTKSVETAYLIGQFGAIGGNIGGASVVQSGTATSLAVSGTSASSVTVGGYVSNFSAAGGVNANVSSTGLVSTVTSTNTSVITNNGVVENHGSSTVNGGASSTSNNVVSAGTKEDLDSIRTQVASGHRNFADETIKLDKDINLNGIAFTPIANISRENKGVEAAATAAFAGTFDGNGHSINNFSTSGFSITGLNAGTNKSTPFFTNAKTEYNEAVYGLFGVTYNAVIKNLNVTCDIDMVLDNNRHFVGDSIGGIVGCAFGTITFENCTVGGTISGYDGVGGFLGRLKGSSATFINCTNNADVTGVRKTGGFIGSSYDGAYSVTYTNCVNNGNITCLGIEKDVELGCWNSNGTAMLTEDLAKNGDGYYTASASNGEFLSADLGTRAKQAGVCGTITVEGFTNNGKVKVGTKDVANGTYRYSENNKTKYFKG